MPLTACQTPTNNWYEIFSSPFQEGGLDIKDPNDHDNDYKWAKRISDSLKQNIPEASVPQQDGAHEVKFKTLERMRKKLE